MSEQSDTEAEVIQNLEADEAFEDESPSDQALRSLPGAQPTGSYAHLYDELIS